jgi:hypothetical protein
MFKTIILLAALFAFSSAQWNNLGATTQEVQNCARWALDQLTNIESESDVDGSYLMALNYKNIKYENVEHGRNYQFTSDVLYQNADNKYTVS